MGGFGSGFFVVCLVGGVVGFGFVFFWRHSDSMGLNFLITL